MNFVVSSMENIGIGGGLWLSSTYHGLKENSPLDHGRLMGATVWHGYTLGNCVKAKGFLDIHSRVYSLEWLFFLVFFYMIIESI
jgi:hypothetical protein